MESLKKMRVENNQCVIRRIYTIEWKNHFVKMSEKSRERSDREAEDKI